MQDTAGERGQAVVEFGLIATVLFMLSLGLVDVGRGIYQYNALSAAARYAARWGSVVGGTCNGNTDGMVAPSTANDWCNQNSYSTPPTVTGACNTPNSTYMAGFWSYKGNYPLQCGDTASTRNCPTSYNSSYSYYYKVSDYTGANDTSIVGAIARRFDTNTSGSYDAGSRTPGFDLTQLYVCIQLPWDSTSDMWQARIGDKVQVFVYYPFHPVTPLLSKANLNLVASSEFPIE